jgi:hypothetical protein
LVSVAVQVVAWPLKIVSGAQLRADNSAGETKLSEKALETPPPLADTTAL